MLSVCPPFIVKSLVWMVSSRPLAPLGPDGPDGPARPVWFHWIAVSFSSCRRCPPALDRRCSCSSRGSRRRCQGMVAYATPAVTAAPRIAPTASQPILREMPFIRPTRSSSRPSAEPA